MRIWLYRTCQHKAADYREGARQRLLVPLSEEARAVAAVPSFEHELEERDELRIFLDLVEELRPERRAVLAGYLPEDRTMAEVAAELAISEKTAWTRYYAAIADLTAARQARRGREKRRRRTVPRVAPSMGYPRSGLGRAGRRWRSRARPGLPLVER